MLRSIVVALKPADSQAACVDYAVTLADRLRLRIEGLSVVDHEQLAAESIPIEGDANEAQRHQERVERARLQANQLVQALESAARAKSLDCHAQVSEGDTVQEIVRAVQPADLLVCGHRPDTTSRDYSRLTSILRHVPRPMLFVPTKAVTGQHVLVAYDSSFQSARALASFVNSGMAFGHAITVLALHENVDVASECAKTAVEFLRRHDIVANVLVEKLQDEPGRHILDAAQRISAGLLVMGAFGKSAVRELHFGSATREVLQRLPIPVFLDH